MFLELFKKEHEKKSITKNFEENGKEGQARLFRLSKGQCFVPSYLLCSESERAGGRAAAYRAAYTAEAPTQATAFSARFYRLFSKLNLSAR